MNTINTYVFSGTGNTLLVSQKLKEELLNYNFTCNVNKITTGEDIFEEADKIIIAYPIHGFNAPTNVTNFVKNMPVGKADVYFLKNKWRRTTYQQCVELSFGEDFRKERLPRVR